MPRVSVIIPAYNCERRLSRAIDSILMQSFQDFEIILINDGSTDKTDEVFDYYYKNTSKIKYIKQPNSGPSSARNKGIVAAAGEIICFLDSDDYYTPNSLDLRVKGFNLYKNADIVIGKTKLIKKVNNHLQIRINEFNRFYSPTIMHHYRDFYLCDAKKFQNIALDKGTYVHTNSLSIRRSKLIELGLFDESLRLNEDIDLWYRAFFSIDNFVFIKDVLSVYNYYLMNHECHERIDIIKYFSFERKRFVKLIGFLNKKGYGHSTVSILKRKLYARKYKNKGILEYRIGNNLKALKLYLKSWLIYQKDFEMITLILKTFIPSNIRDFLKKINLKLNLDG
jgi:glycosyltransferase involved in cell wall biosynthesis